MQKVLVFVILCSSFLVGQNAQNESSGNPVTGTAKNIFQRQQKTLIAAAEQMPADKYDFKPTPQQNPFGQTVAHVIGSNYVICSRFNDSTAPAMDTLPKATDGKDKLVAALKQSIDFCNSALDSLADSKLGDQVTLFRGMKVPRAYALFALTNDFADHYAAMAMYMRLNGILPPSAQQQQRPAQAQGTGQQPSGQKPPQ
jgi:uncharacterized damage-inducible protein DinB